MAIIDRLQSPNRLIQLTKKNAIPAGIALLGLLNNIAAKPLQQPKPDPIDNFLDLLGLSICIGGVAIFGILAFISLKPEKKK
jgi:hypothetical protein